MKYYDIPNLPSQIDELLYDHQRAEILKRIPSPIVCLLEGDPDWDRVDRLLTADNNVMDMSKWKGVQVTLHELLPGVHSVWIEDDYPYADPDDSAGECILINATDLHLIREGGLDALVQHYLFKSF